MENYKINSLYSEMVKNIQKRPYQVLRGTKTLALSSPKYYSFYKSSTDSLQTKTFKLPDETEYPKLIQSKYISLQKKINIFSFKSKNNIQKKPVIKPQSAKYYSKNSYLSEKIKKRKSVNFFVGENFYKSRYKLYSSHYRNYSQLNNMSNINIYDSNTKDSYLYSIKNSEKRVKDFFMLLNSIFYDEDYYYNDLKYNEKEIFGHKEEYLNYIKDELNYFIKEEKDFDIKSDLLQLFMTKKYGKIELFLKSARIDVIEENLINKQEEKLFTINIPFHLMSMIYLLNGEQINFLTVILLKKFKLDTIQINEEERVVFYDTEKKNIFLGILNLVKFKNDKIYFDLDQKNYERYYSQLKYLEKIKDITESLKYNNFLSSFFKDHSKIKIIDNSNKNIYNSPNYKKNNNINFETNINKYTLYIISLQYKYKIYFYLPEIELIFNEYKKQINHFIDKELFLYLYQNNFMYWDYYVLHFLFSYKNFRQFMSGILSVTNQISNYSKKINYFLSKTKLKNENNKNNLEEIKNIPVEIDKCQITDLYSYEYGLNDNSYEFTFLFSNSINLSLYKLKSYTLYVFFLNINKPIIYEFNFNYKQMKILYYISLFEYLIVFLKRLLYIKNDNVYLDYSYFDSFTKMTNKEIFSYFNDLHAMSGDKKLINLIDNQKKNNLNSLSLRICEPFIEITDFYINDENIKIVQSSIKLKNDFLDELINININNNNLIDKIYNFRKDFDIKYHVKYEETRNKKIRRQITTGNKNKDIHKVFNKFLKIS